MSRNQRRKKRNKQGGGQNANRNQNAIRSQNANRGQKRDSTEDESRVARFRSSTETKSALKTTELIAYAGAVLAVIITALAVDEDGQGGDDPFGAGSAIRYITYLTIGYMIARGLAKSGSHENRVQRDADTATDDGAAARTVVVGDPEPQDDGDGDERGIEGTRRYDDADVRDGARRDDDADERDGADERDDADERDADGGRRAGDRDERDRDERDRDGDAVHSDADERRDDERADDRDEPDRHGDTLQGDGTERDRAADALHSDGADQDIDTVTVEPSDGARRDADDVDVRP